MSDISREDEIIGANVKKFRESQGYALDNPVSPRSIRYTPSSEM